MELLFGIIFLFGGVGILANQDSKTRNTNVVGKEIRFIQETKETTYKAEVIKEWEAIND